MTKPAATEPDALSVKPAPRAVRRRRLVLGAGGLAALLAVLLAVLGIVHHRTAEALRPALFVQTPGTLDDIQFTRDGRLLMTTECSAGQFQVTFRDAQSGRIVRQWPAGSGQKWLSAEGTRLLETDYDRHGSSQSFLYNAFTGHILRHWPGQIGDVRPDFSWMTVADSVVSVPAPLGSLPGRNTYIRPKTGQVVEVETGRVVGQFPLPSGFLGDAALSSIKPYLYLTGYDHPAQLLRLPSMTPVLTGLPPLNSLRVTWDGTRVVGSDKNGLLHFWALPSGQHTTGPTGFSYVFSAAPLKNGELLVYGTQGQKPHGRVVIQVRSADGTRILHSFSDSPLAYSLDDRLMATDVYSGPSDDNTCAIWNLATGQREALLNRGTDALGNPLSDSNLGGGRLAIAPDGRQFVYAVPSGLLRFFRPGQTVPVVSSSLISTDSGKSVLSFGMSSGYSPGVSDAVVLPGGGVAAVGGQDISRDDRRVQFWQPGQDVWSVKAVVGNGDVEHLGVSPDGTQLVGSSEWGLWMLDLKTHVSSATPIQPLPRGQQGYSSHTPGQPVWLDGPGHLATVVSQQDFQSPSIRLARWDAAGQFLDEKTVVPAKQVVGSRTFRIAETQVSPDGTRLAVAWNEVISQTTGGAGRLELRDTRSGRLLKTLTATPKVGSLYVRSAEASGHPTFSLDGKRLAATDDTGGVSVWDTSTGSLLGRLSGTQGDPHNHTSFFAGPGVRGGMIRTAFTPDNQHLAVGRADGSVYLYSLHLWLPVAELGQTVLWTGTPEQVHVPLRWLAFAPDGRTLYGYTVNGADVFSWPVPALTNNR